MGGVYGEEGKFACSKHSFYSRKMCKITCEIFFQITDSMKDSVPTTTESFLNPTKASQFVSQINIFEKDATAPCTHRTVHPEVLTLNPGSGIHTLGGTITTE